LSPCRDATYFAFDWDAFDGSREPQTKRLLVPPVIVFEGV
jgi:hypothetical protein